MGAAPSLYLSLTDILPSLFLYSSLPNFLQEEGLRPCIHFRLTSELPTLSQVLRSPTAKERAIPSRPRRHLDPAHGHRSRANLGVFLLKPQPWATVKPGGRTANDGPRTSQRSRHGNTDQLLSGCLSLPQALAQKARKSFLKKTAEERASGDPP